MKIQAIRTRCLLGHSHPSRSESEYCLWLQARKQNGEIRDFKYIGSVDLHVAGKVWKKWAIDFKVDEKDGSVSYHESKGWNRSDDNFRMKLTHFRMEYPDVDIYVNKQLVTGSGWRRKPRRNQWTRMAKSAK